MFIIGIRSDLNYVLYSDSFHYASSHLKLNLASVVGELSNYLGNFFLNSWVLFLMVTSVTLADAARSV
jgi:hypothetical protein